MIGGTAPMDLTFNREYHDDWQEALAMRQNWLTTGRSGLVDLIILY